MSTDGTKIVVFGFEEKDNFNESTRMSIKLQHASHMRTIFIYNAIGDIHAHNNG